MDSLPFGSIVQLGATGVVFYFAYALLKATLTQITHLGELLENHLTALLKRQEAHNEALAEIVMILKTDAVMTQKIQEKCEKIQRKISEGS